MQASQRWEVHQDPEVSWIESIRPIAMAGFVLYLPFPVIPELSHLRDMRATQTVAHCWHCFLQTSPAPCTEMHQKGFSLPIYKPAVCHATLLLRPCPESTSWICIFSFVKHTWKPQLPFLLRVTALFSIQTNRNQEYSVSTGWKTYQVLCATAFLTRLKSL